MVKVSKDRAEQSSHIAKGLKKPSNYGYITADGRNSLLEWISWSFAVDLLVIVEGRLIRLIPFPDLPYLEVITALMAFCCLLVLIPRTRLEDGSEKTQRTVGQFLLKYPWIPLVLFFPLLVLEVIAKLGKVSAVTVAISLLVSGIAVLSIVKEFKKMSVQKKLGNYKRKSLRVMLNLGGIVAARVGSLLVVAAVVVADLSTLFSVSLVAAFFLLYTDLHASLEGTETELF